MIAIISTLCAAVAVGLFAAVCYDFWTDVTEQYLRDLVKKSDAVSLDVSKRTVYMNGIGIALIADVALVAGILKSPLIALSIGLLLVVLPRQIVAFRIRKHTRTLKDQMVDAVSMIAGSVRANMTLEAAIEYAANNVPAPLGAHLQQISESIKLGTPPVRALKESQKRLQFQEYSIFAATLIVHYEHGGRQLLPTLEEIKASLMENRRLERKIQSETATGRFVINALCATPAIFTVLSFFSNPQGAKLLFTTQLGQLVIFVVTLLSYAGFVVGQKVVNIEV